MDQNLRRGGGTKVRTKPVEKARALKRTGFLETLRYDATTTTAVLSSIAHKLITPRCLISSPISSLIMWFINNTVYISNLLINMTFDENLSERCHID